MRTRTIFLLAGAALLSGGGGALARAVPLAQPVGADLVATVGPDFTVSLSTAAGAPARQLDPGTYTIRVEDRSEFHNFRLTGPGVDRATGVAFVGTETWEVTLAAGGYRFLCDPHATQMRGTLTVGTPPAAPKRTRVTITVGPGRTLAVTPRTLRPGPHVLVVRDRSRTDNVHVVGPGVNRRTGLRAVGTVRWNVTLRAGTYRVSSDRKAGRLARVVRVR